MMVELTPDEHWILKFGFYGCSNPFQPRQKGRIVHELRPPVGRDARPILKTLIEKKALSESPDKTYVRLTDYGHQIFKYFEEQQTDWNEQEVSKVDDANRDEILIRKGDFFSAYWITRKICLNADKSIVIQDNYIGPDLFKLRSEIPTLIEIKVLTSEKPYKDKEAAELAYTNLKKQNPRIEMKRSNDFHARYIFIDGQICYELGHSIKDLGTKEAIIKKLHICEELYSEFNKRWLSAKNV
ncbi:MAG: hypothetical protein MUO78_09455 [candidate division Zixibacteria bacterium]|nr:hypothetical protein [candidate division Zixibacteria bacterium]